MAIIGFTGSGYVGDFLTLADLTAKYPPNQYAGRQGSVTASGIATTYFSDGTNWGAIGDVDNTRQQGLVLIGDSWMQLHGISAASALNNVDQGFWVWACAKMKQRIEILGNIGVSGWTTQNVADNLETLITPYLDLKFAAVSCGVNDATIPFATSVANYEKIISYLKSKGFIVFWHTPGPYGLTVDRSRFVTRLAEYVRHRASELDCILIDNYSAVVNPASLLGEFKTAMTAEAVGLHVNVVGARTIGDLAIAAATPYISQNAQTVDSQANTPANYTTSATQILPNPLLITAGGTVVGIGQSGVIPSGWTTSVGVSATGVWSSPARADGFGNDIQVVVSAAGDGGSVTATSGAVHGNLSPGDVIQLDVTVSATGMTGVRSIGVSWVYQSATAPTYFEANALRRDIAGATPNYWDNTDIVEYVFRTRPFIVPGVATNFIVKLGASFDTGGGGTFKFGRVGVRKLQK